MPNKGLPMDFSLRPVNRDCAWALPLYIYLAQASPTVFLWTPLGKQENVVVKGNGAVYPNP